MNKKIIINIFIKVLLRLDFKDPKRFAWYVYPAVYF
jgi:hypothetical protein